MASWGMPGHSWGFLHRAARRTWRPHSTVSGGAYVRSRIRDISRACADTEGAGLLRNCARTGRILGQASTPFLLNSVLNRHAHTANRRHPTHPAQSAVALCPRGPQCSCVFLLRPDLGWCTRPHGAAAPIESLSTDMHAQPTGATQPTLLNPSVPCARVGRNAVAFFARGGACTRMVLQPQSKASYQTCVHNHLAETVGALCPRCTANELLFTVVVHACVVLQSPCTPQACHCHQTTDCH